MTETTSIHPDVVQEALLSTASHPTKRRNLNLVHEVCLEREAQGNKDFSLKAIGEAVEARGGFKVKALWNPQSADYRKLIDAWQAFSGAPNLRATAKVGATDALTRSISDPATRIVVEKLVRERNSLRAEVNILKSQTNVVVDRRPTGRPKTVHSTSDGAMTLEVSTDPVLNTLELEALEHSVSAALWHAEGWCEEKNGRVIKELGEGRSRTIFKPGFVSAIRKILHRK